MAYVLRLKDFDRADWVDCAASGPVDEAVAYLVRRYADQFERIPLDNMREHLRGFGAWDDLDEADATTLYQRLAFAETTTMLELGLIWVD